MRILTALIFFSVYSFSAALIEINYVIFTDKTTAETNGSSTSSKSVYNFNLGFSIDSKKNLYFGWGLYNVNTKDEVNSQILNYLTQDMGPYLRYEIGKSNLFFVSLTYGIQSKTDFDTGGTAETWLGTNYLIQLGVNPEIAENFNAEFSLNYFSGTTKTKVISSVQSDVSYTKSFMSPTIGLAYKW